MRVALSRTAAALPILRMVETRALGADVRVSFDIWTSPEQLLAMAQNNRHQVYVLPLTLAARLYNKDVPIRLTNVSVWGGIALVSTDPDIQQWTDLPGKHIHLPQRSSPPDILLRYFLRQAGVEEESIEFSYSTIPEIAQLLTIGRIQTGLLMEPRTTAALIGSDKVRIVFDFEQEWQRINGSDASLPSLGFGLATSFADENPVLARQLDQSYAEAVQWVVEHPAESGALAEKYLGLSARLIEKALPRMGLRYRTAGAAKHDVETLLQLVGERVPDAAFYQE